MSVKSKSRTFKPGEEWFTIMRWINNNIAGALSDPKSAKAKVKKRLVITITYERDDKTE